MKKLMVAATSAVSCARASLPGESDARAAATANASTRPQHAQARTARDEKRVEAVSTPRHADPWRMIKHLIVDHLPISLDDEQSPPSGVGLGGTGENHDRRLAGEQPRTRSVDQPEIAKGHRWRIGAARMAAL